MRWTIRGRTLKRLAFALATAQMLAYAAAPVIEAQTEHAPGPTHIERTHSSHCVRIHQPDTCLACQLVSLRARAGERTSVPVMTSQVAASDPAARTVTVPRAPPRTTRSRAPPLPVA
jgi:hypothetical protein